MSSPLILRIVTTADTSGIQQVSGAFRNLQVSGLQISSTLKGTSGIMRQLSGDIKNVAPIPPAVNLSVQTLFAGLRGIKMAIRQMKMGLFIGTFIFGPIIMATKQALALERQTNSLITTLNQLGYTGQTTGRQFIKFAEDNGIKKDKETASE